MLQFAGILGRLDCLITNEDVDRAKPHPDIYLAACDTLEVAPSRTLVIEDHQFGVQSALAAGCQVIQVSGPEDVTIPLVERYLSGDDCGGGPSDG
jgi:beta-phosphoglucomutase-like phosphatase (HAD superfamily)